MRNLFFWRGIEDASFKPAEGGFLFYPYGALARGYVVTPAQKAELGAFLRRYYLIGTIVILFQIVAGALLGYFTVLAVVVPALALLLLYVHFGIRARLGNAPRSAQRLSLGEAQRMATRTMSGARVAVIVVLGGLMVAGALFVLYLGISTGDSEAMITGGFGAAFFGLLFLVGCYNAWLKWAR
jgi:hypothetical protein